MSNTQNEFLKSKMLLNNMCLVLNSIKTPNKYFNEISIDKLGSNIFNNITNYNDEVFEIFQMEIFLNEEYEGVKSNNIESYIQIDLYKDGKIICNIIDSDPYTSETELQLPFLKGIECLMETGYYPLYEKVLDRITFNIEYKKTHVINSLAMFNAVEAFNEDWTIDDYSIDISGLSQENDSLYYWARKGILNSYNCEIHYGKLGIYSGNISVNLLKDTSIGEVEITTDDIELTISDVNNKYFIDLVEEITKSNFICEKRKYELSLKTYVNLEEVPKKLYEILHFLSLMDKFKK
ncbi:hypothetical protein [Staphylococcus simulans]